MPVICLGPVCIPIWGLLPFFLALLVKFKDRAFIAFGLKEPEPAPALAKGMSHSASGEDLLSSAAAAAASEEEEDGRPHRVIAITSKEQWDEKRRESISSGQPLFVDFTASWCKPCKKVAPVFQMLSKQFPKSIFVEVDVDAMDVIAQDHSISAMPTFQVHRGGAFVDEVKGAYVEKLKEMVRRHGVNADKSLRRLQS